MNLTQRYKLQLSRKAVVPSRDGSLPAEHTVYGIFTDFLTPFKANYPERFTIYPQMSLKWKPQIISDRRAEVPDVGIGNLTPPGADVAFKLRCGVEAKRAIEVMTSLPHADEIRDLVEVKAAFHQVYFQAQNQAKAAFKNGYYLHQDKVLWICLVGPYWVLYTFGAFTEAQSSVRAGTHKMSQSGDWEQQVLLNEEMASPPPPLRNLYRLDTEESRLALQEILESTDDSASAIRAHFLDAFQP